MNLRHIADRRLSLAIRKADGTPLARRKVDPDNALDGQGFRYPQWLDDDSAKPLLAFLDGLWDREDDEGLDDPVRIARGQAPRMTSSERRVVELHAGAAGRHQLREAIVPTRREFCRDAVRARLVAAASPCYRALARNV